MTSAEKICRLCIKDSYSSFDLNDDDCDGIKYADKFKLLFTDLILKDGDTHLPSSLCTQCCTKLKDAYNFKKLCMSSLNFWQTYQHQNSEEKASVSLLKNAIEFVKTEMVLSEIDENKNLRDEFPVPNGNNFSGLRSDNNLDVAENVKTEVSSSESSNDATTWDSEQNSNGNQLDFSNISEKVEGESMSEDSKLVPGGKKGRGPLPHPFSANIDPSSYVADSVSKIFLCKKCDKYFANRNSLKKHMVSHTGVKPYSCSICGKKTFTASSLKYHMMIHDKDSRFPCQVCPKSFKDKKTLSQHMKFHSEMRPHMCDTCGKGFVLLSGLKNHMVIHSDERKFQCSVCQKRFKTQSSLKLHTDKHANRTFHCAPCNKTFPKYDGYYWHNKKTHGERNIRCHICDRSFFMKVQLTRHLKTHTNELSVSCEICKRLFSSNQVLKRHMRTHTGERPYHCQICDKSFAHSANLQVHMRIHTGNPTYHFKCQLCDKGFILLYHFENHMKKHHSSC